MSNAEFEVELLRRAQRANRAVTVAALVLGTLGAIAGR
jgi:hypothetical protein